MLGRWYWSIFVSGPELCSYVLFFLSHSNLFELGAMYGVLGEAWSVESTSFLSDASSQLKLGPLDPYFDCYNHRHFERGQV